MPSFSYVDYVYFYDFDKNTKLHNESFIRKKWPNINIMTPNRLISKNLMNVSKI